MFNKSISIRRFIAATCCICSCLLGTQITAQVDRSQAPEAGPQPVLSIGSYTLDTLDNGLQVIVVENHRLPRISWNLTLNIKPRLELEKVGCASIAGELMRSGTAEQTKRVLDERIDFIGGQLTTSATFLRMSSLTDFSEEALDVMTEVLLKPSFPEEELEKVRNQRLSGLAALQTSSGGISSNLRSRLLYGGNHPYGEVETEESLKSITREDLVGYHADNFRPNVSYMVVVGDITREHALEMIQSRLGEWIPREVPNYALINPTRPMSKQVCFASIPGAVQSDIHVTHLVRMKPGHPDAMACAVMNGILGGGAFGNRLNQNIREDKGYSYGARSSFVTDPVMGFFDAYASVRNEVTDSTVVEMLYEIKRMTQDLVDPDMVQKIINYMTGSFARSLEQPETIARFALNIARYNLPLDYYETYLERLAEVTPEEVLRVAINYLRPSHLYITVVGDPSVIDDLQVFTKDGEVHMYDAFGFPVLNLVSAPEGETALTVIDRFYEVCGGASNFEKLKSLSQSGTMEAGPGMTLKVAMESAFGVGHVMRIAMEGQTVMEQTITPSGGTQSQMNQKSPMDEEEFQRFESSLFAAHMLHFGELGLDAMLVGMDEKEGTTSYVIEVKRDDTLEETLYFNADSDMLERSVAMHKGPTGPVQITRLYGTYEMFKGLLFPTELREISNGQNMTIKWSEIVPNARIDKTQFE